MEIDFNNLRLQTAYALDRVIKTLNAGIMPSDDWSSHTMEDGKIKSWSGDVLVNSEDLQKSIDELRQNIGILLCCFEPDNPEYRMLYDEVKESGGIEWFNDPERNLQNQTT